MREKKISKIVTNRLHFEMHVVKRTKHQVNTGIKCQCRLKLKLELRSVYETRKQMLPFCCRRWTR